MTACIHIGTPKTGTTSIQQFLYANKELLLKDKILYPSSIILDKQFDPQHWDLAILLNNFCEDNIMQNGLVALLHNEIKNTQPDSVILSSEAFQSIVKYENIKNLKYLLIKLGFKKVNIILYIRDAAEVWMSLCSEFLKNGLDSDLAHKKIYENNLLRQILDYKSTLIHWGNIFGKDAIILRYFDKKYLYQNDLIKDFVHVAEIKWNENFVIPKRQNESLNLIGIEILKHLNNKSLVCNGALYHDLIPYFNSHFTKKEHGLTFYPPQNFYSYYKEYSHVQFKWINKHFNFPLCKYKMSERYRENYELNFIRKEYFVDIANFIADLFSSKNKTLLQKQNQIDMQNKTLLQKQNQIDKMIFEIRYASAKIRVQNHLSYKLGQAMIVNSKSLLGYIRMPFVLSYIKDKHKQEQKVYQEKIKKDPSLKLPPLESYLDYKEALREKECLTYKLGEALIKVNGEWWGIRYIRLWFMIKKIKNIRTTNGYRV